MAAERLQLSDYPEPGSPAGKTADSSWWFTVAAFVLAVLLVVCAPELTGPWWQRALRAAGLAALSFAVVFLAGLAIRRCGWLLERWRKGRLYDVVYELAASAQRRHQASRDLIKHLLPSASLYLGVSASAYNGRLLVEFSKKGRRTMPAVGTMLHLLDCENGSSIGRFRVTQSDGINCQAIDQGDIDPLFRGYAIQQGARFLPGDYALFAIPEEENNNG